MLRRELTQPCCDSAVFDHFGGANERKQESEGISLLIHPPIRPARSDIFGQPQGVKYSSMYIPGGGGVSDAVEEEAFAIDGGLRVRPDQRFVIHGAFVAGLIFQLKVKVRQG